MSLVADGVSKRFGGLAAVDNVDLSVSPGELVSLVGPNGAGKTTCFNLITGFLPVTAGRVLVDGTDVTRLRPDQRVRHGVVRTFQTTSLFTKLTALENVELALLRERRDPWWRVVLPVRLSTGADRARELLAMVGIADKAEQRADAMAYGDQRRLAVAIALATSPRYLLLDEPAAGLNTRESELLGRLLRELVDRGLGILLVGHDMNLVMSVSDRVVVLATGRTMATGTPEEIRRHPDVIEAYLGKGIR
jgi:branched-chain amino acid transport system ATP-binding protein